MKKRFICICLVFSIVASTLTACTSGGSSSGSSSKSWEKDANSAGYYKKNGKWYYQGKGAY